jgi:hypothetical protein
MPPGSGPSRLSRSESFLNRVCGVERANQFDVRLDLPGHEPRGAQAGRAGQG